MPYFWKFHIKRSVRVTLKVLFKVMARFIRKRELPEKTADSSINIGHPKSIAL